MLITNCSVCISLQVVTLRMLVGVVQRMICIDTRGTQDSGFYFMEE